jgi:outer membrane protein assembly factor BamB
VALIVVVGAIAILPAQSAIAPPPVAPLPPTLPGTVIPVPEPPSTVWWTVALPAGANGPPVIAGDHVYVARLPGTVAAYRIVDGKEAWATDIVPDQPLAVDADLVIVASGDRLHALRGSDGTQVWQIPVGALTAPLLAKDGWVIAASATKLTAIRAKDGGVIWSEETGPVRERGAIMGDTLFVPVADGAIVARDLTTGKSRWERRLNGAPQEPLAIGDRVFVGASDRHFYSIKIDSGEIDWPYRVGAAIRGAPATDGERVYFVALDHLVWALDYRSGAMKWQSGVSFRPFTGPVLVGTTLMISGAVDDVRLLQARSGQPSKTVSLPQDLAVPPAVGTVKGMNVLAAITGGLAASWRLTLIGLAN